METEVCIADGEQVASSQGSEVFNPNLHMRKMIQLQAPGEILPKPRLAPESALTTPVTPATFKVRVFYQTNNKLHIRPKFLSVISKIIAKSSKL